MNENNSKLLAGWMPQCWWGDEAPKIRRRKKSGPKEPKKPEMSASDPRIDKYRSRLRWIRLVVSDDVKNGRAAFIPVNFDLQMTIKGEEYFLTICQAIFRERFLKESLGERFDGEDLIARLVRWWAQGPLNSELLQGAIEGTSLDNEAEED